jgi:hypothetical protein
MAGDQQIKNSRNRSYLAKDFDSTRAELLTYAKTYFGDKIQDFSEASLGGLLLDLAASVSDNMSFYLDHQFKELSWSSAIENSNITRMLREAGVKTNGASPAVATVSIFVEVPSKLIDGEYVPDESTLPIIRQNSQLNSRSSVVFSTTEDIDFSEKTRLGNLRAQYVVGNVDASGNPSTFILKRDVKCVSGKVFTESFTITSNPSPFLTISLSNIDINEIMKVEDSEGYEYYEVQSLSQDTVFKTFPNMSSDSEEVPRSIAVIPAPRRFIKSADPLTRITTIQFGSGNASSTDDDILPDPEILALPLYGKTVMNRFTLDPNSLLKTNTLGILPKSTIINITYRAGGGANHNVAALSIRGITSMVVDFPDECLASIASSVKASIDVRNDSPAAGGAAAPTIEELRSQIPIARTQQDRIVTKEDLISRVYTLPSNFGRVFRAASRPSPDNPLSSQLFLCSRDSNGFLTTTTDTLKKNLKVYLNEYRLISDAIDILDARIINFRLKFTIFINPNSNKSSTLQAVITRVSDIMSINNFQIDQPIIISDIQNVIINTPGVLTLVDIKIESLTGTIQDRSYSTVTHNIKQYTRRGIIYGPPGSIFEMRYPQYDIVGTAL